MQILTGISVSAGVAIAEAVILDAEDYRIPTRSVDGAKVGEEIARLETARSNSIDELVTIKEQVEQQQGRDAADVFSWHIGVLRDEGFIGSVRRLIDDRHYSSSYATSVIMRQQQRRFLQMGDPLLAERMRDLRDIERRMLRHILGKSREDLAHLTRPVILIAHDLTPSQSVHLAETKVAGVVLDVGGATSHTGILLRAIGRPAVVGVGDASTQINGGDQVIVDAVNHLVIVEPDAATLTQYRERVEEYGRLSIELSELRDLPSVTRDAVPVQLLGNIEFPHEVKTCLAKGATGIGLYRTEFLLLGGQGEPSESEQFQAYREAIDGIHGQPITIRTFDLGADKYTQEREYEQERNPMLGLRSIRYSLQNLDMFKRQIRSILRAAADRPGVRLMFPLIVSLMEFRQARMTVHDAMEDLEEEGIAFGRDVKLGMMMETPAAVFQCKDFVREVDFVSIGTNDLVQYLLAVDRTNQRVSRFYNPLHPSVLHAIQGVIKACQRANVDCSLCGEIAGQPLYTLLLLGLGLRSFSMAPGNIPEIKKLVRLSTINHARRVAKRALSFETERQVHNYLMDETRKMLPHDPI